MQPTHHPNRPLSSVPASQPDPARAGRIVATPGLPFEHNRGVCGRWGALRLAYDPAKAKQLLAEAGHPRHTSPPPSTATVAPEPSRQDRQQKQGTSPQAGTGLYSAASRPPQAPFGVLALRVTIPRAGA